MRALRIDEMERFIRKNGVVSLETLGEHFNVSLNTIRRDIVITNNLRVMERACAMENIALIALPGQLHHRNISFNGSDQAVFFDRYNVRTAFMPAAGISLSRGITYGSTVEADFARHVLARCPLRVLMVDHTKFDVVGLTTMADFNSIDVLVTDEPPGEAYVEALSRAHVRLVVANKIQRG